MPDTPHVRSLTFADSWPLTPVNEFRGGFARQWHRIEGPLHDPTIIRQLRLLGYHPDLPDRPGFPQTSPAQNLDNHPDFNLPNFTITAPGQV